MTILITTNKRLGSQRDKDIAFMMLAIEEARLSCQEDEVPIGAIIVIDDKVVSMAHNITESCNDPTAHAEVLAIREASHRLRRWRLSDASIYVTVEPCSMCAGAIILGRIHRLIYGCADPKAGACGSVFDIPGENRLNHRLEVLSGILEIECKRLLQDFFIRLRSKRQKRVE